VGLAALLFAPQATPLPQLEYWTADWRTALLSDRTPTLHRRIAVVVIDDTTLEAYPYLTPTDRSFLAELVLALDLAKADVVGLDFLFIKETEKDKDAALVLALQPDVTLGRFVLGVADDRVSLTPSQRKFQDRFLAKIERPKGYLNLLIDSDEVIRYKPRHTTVRDSFAEAITRAAGLEPKKSSRIAWLVGPDGKSPFPIVRAEALIAAARNPASGADILSQVAGRIVLVGVDRPFQDQHSTPLGVRSGEKMPGLLVHAQMVADTVDGRQVSELTREQTQILVLGMWLTGCVLSWLASRHGFSFARWTLGTMLFVAIDVLLFYRWRLVLPFTSGMAAWVLGVTAGQFMREISFETAARKGGAP
jgi:CHASE2 domain-containing sensor protein